MSDTIHKYSFLILIGILIAVKSDFFIQRSLAKRVFIIGSNIYIKTYDHRLWKTENINGIHRILEKDVLDFTDGVFDSLDFAIKITGLDCGEPCDKINGLVICMGSFGIKKFYRTFRAESNGNLIKSDDLPNGWGLNSSGPILFYYADDRFFHKILNKRIESFFYYNKTIFIQGVHNDTIHMLYWKTISDNGSISNVWNKSNMLLFSKFSNFFPINQSEPLYATENEAGDEVWVTRIIAELKPDDLELQFDEGFSNNEIKRFFKSLGYLPTNQSECLSNSVGSGGHLWFNTSIMLLIIIVILMIFMITDFVFIRNKNSKSVSQKYSISETLSKSSRSVSNKTSGKSHITSKSSKSVSNMTSGKSHNTSKSAKSVSNKTSDKSQKGRIFGK